MPWRENNAKDSGKETDSFEIELQPLVVDTSHDETQEVVGPHDSSHDEIEEIDARDEPQPSVQEQSDLTDYQLTRDRQRRVSRPSTRYSEIDFVGYTFNFYFENFGIEPDTFNQAIKSEHSDLRLAAMNSKLESLHSNRTWKLVQKLEGHKVVDCKWVFKLKPGLKVTDPLRYKGRLVAKRVLTI